MIGLKEQQDRLATISSDYVIQSCTRDDLSAVSTLLAEVTMESEGGALGFRGAVRALHAKAEFESQLNARLSCIEAGHTLVNRGQVPPVDYDLARHFWSNDAFRRKVEIAAGKAAEASCFRRHNFAITPSNDMLQHAMFVVRECEQVVGFCEVAMLMAPDSGQMNDGDDLVVQPMIMNLAISPPHRRRGLANRLTQSALRYTQRYFCANCDKSMGLFVNEDNDDALRLYRRNGFQIQAVVNDQYYMECSLDGSDNYVEEECILFPQDGNVMVAA